MASSADHAAAPPCARCAAAEAAAATAQSNWEKTARAAIALTSKLADAEEQAAHARTTSGISVVAMIVLSAAFAVGCLTGAILMPDRGRSRHAVKYCNALFSLPDGGAAELRADARAAERVDAYAAAARAAEPQGFVARVWRATVGGFAAADEVAAPPPPPPAPPATWWEATFGGAEARSSDGDGDDL